MDGLVTGMQLKFDLTNIHFHTPSEHAIDSTKYSAEGHFVHTLNTAYTSPTNFSLTKLAIGVMFDASSNVADPFIDTLNLTNYAVSDAFVSP